MESESAELTKTLNLLMLHKKINEDLEAKFIKMKDELQEAQKEKEEVNKMLMEVKKESASLKELIQVANTNLMNFFNGYNKNSSSDLNITWLELGIGKDSQQETGK